MKFKLITFKKLKPEQLYDILQLRSQVFVVEQNCVYQDMDGKDREALHLIGYAGRDMAAYARLLKPGVNYKEAAIGRVVVAKNFRGKEYGKEIMKSAIRHCIIQFKTKVIVVSAQKYLENFYSELGFVTEGKGYLEDGIPHIKMRFTKK